MAQSPVASDLEVRAVVPRNQAYDYALAKNSLLETTSEREMEVGDELIMGLSLKKSGDTPLPYAGVKIRITRDEDFLGEIEGITDDEGNWTGTVKWEEKDRGKITILAVVDINGSEVEIRSKLVINVVAKKCKDGEGKKWYWDLSESGGSLMFKDIFSRTPLFNIVESRAQGVYVWSDNHEANTDNNYSHHPRDSSLGGGGQNSGSNGN